MFWAVFLSRVGYVAMLIVATIVLWLVRVVLKILNSVKMLQIKYVQTLVVYSWDLAPIVKQIFVVIMLKQEFVV
jgi:hypothetical protein